MLAKRNRGFVIMTINLLVSGRCLFQSFLTLRQRKSRLSMTLRPTYLTANPRQYRIRFCLQDRPPRWSTTKPCPPTTVGLPRNNPPSFHSETTLQATASHVIRSATRKRSEVDPRNARVRGARRGFKKGSYTTDTRLQTFRTLLLRLVMPM